MAPATRPKQISKFRTIVGKNMKIISPGIGTQGGNAKKCFNAGADWIIIGRSIYNSLNPINEIQKYIK